MGPTGSLPASAGSTTSPLPGFAQIRRLYPVTSPIRSSVITTWPYSSGTVRLRRLLFALQIPECRDGQLHRDQAAPIIPHPASMYDIPASLALRLSTIINCIILDSREKSIPNHGFLRISPPPGFPREPSSPANYHAPQNLRHEQNAPPCDMTHITTPHYPRPSTTTEQHSPESHDASAHPIRDDQPTDNAHITTDCIQHDDANDDNDNHYAIS